MPTRIARQGLPLGTALVQRMGDLTALRPLFPKSVSLRGLLLGESLLEIREGSVGRRAGPDGGAASPASGFQMPPVFVVVAVQAQQLPVAAIGRVVVVIVVPVVDGQFAHVGARELAGAAPADPWVDLQRLFPVAAFALLGGTAGIGDEAVQLPGSLALMKPRQPRVRRSDS